MAELKNELTWSFSRDRLFKDCKRAYFYHYYASWGGWNKSSDEFSQKAYLLKNMRNVDIWVGDIIHQILKWVIENKKVGNHRGLDEALTKAKQMLMRTWEQSRSKLWQKNIKQNLNLFEHYYGPELSRDDLALKMTKVTKSIRNFYSSELFSSLSNISQENILAVDALDFFDFSGVRMFAIPDFALKSSDEYVLYDWKTGKPSEKDVLQLSCYILYAQNKWAVFADKISVVPVYLAMDDVLFDPVIPIDQSKVREYIENSISQMRAVLTDQENNKISIDNCPRTKNEWLCKKCRFREICL